MCIKSARRKKNTPYINNSILKKRTFLSIDICFFASRAIRPCQDSWSLLVRGKSFCTQA